MTGVMVGQNTDREIIASQNGHTATQTETTALCDTQNALEAQCRHTTNSQRCGSCGKREENMLHNADTGRCKAELLSQTISPVVCCIFIWHSRWTKKPGVILYR